MNIIDFIKSFDYYGHRPQFHFGSWKKRKQKEYFEYKTFFGGIVSLSIKTVYLLSVIYFLYLLIHHEKDKI